MRFYIFNYRTNAEDGGPLFWSEEKGWGPLNQATVYDQDQKAKLKPVEDGVFVIEKLAEFFI